MFSSATHLASNPIDFVESVFGAKAFEFERRSLNEIVVEIQGKWTNMLLFFSWEENLKCFQLSCFMDMPQMSCSPERMFELLALINEELWLGHFSYWAERKTPVFKHTVIMDNTDFNFENKLSEMIQIALTECEKFYPIFQAVLTQNILPRQALQSLSGYILQ